jgi:hypothetical protein
VARTVRVLALLSLAGCGGGPQLSNLRCRVDPCQHPEKPFTLRLAVDFSDGTGTLSQGALELRVNGATQSAVSLAEIFSAQQLEPAAVKGTLSIDQDVVLDRVGQDQGFNTSLVAHDGLGQQSNEPELGFKLTLGGL